MPLKSKVFNLMFVDSSDQVYRKKKSADFLLASFAGLSVIFLILSYIQGALLYTYLSSFMLFLYVVIISSSRKVFKENFLSVEVFLSFLCVAISAFSVRYNTLGGLYVSANFAASIFVARHLVNYGMKNLFVRDFIFFVSKFVLFFFFAFLVYKSVSVGVTKYDINDFFPLSSRNMVTAVLLAVQIFYCGNFYVRNNRLPKLSPMLTFVFCFFAYGRSGIIISGFLLFLCFFVGSWKNKSWVLCVVVFLVAVFFAPYFYDFDLISLLSGTNLSRGFESIRYLVNIQYVSSMDFVGFFLGQDYSLSPAIGLLDNNPHNSYIHGHHFMGFPYLILMAVVLFKILVPLKKTGRVISVLFLLLFVRGSVDVFLMPGGMTFIAMFMYFLAFRKVAKESVRKPHLRVAS